MGAAALGALGAGWASTKYAPRPSADVEHSADVANFMHRGFETARTTATGLADYVVSFGAKPPQRIQQDAAIAEATKAVADFKQKYKTASDTHKEALKLYAGSTFQKYPDLDNPHAAILNLSDEGAAKILEYRQLNIELANEETPYMRDSLTKRLKSVFKKSDLLTLPISDLTTFLEISDNTQDDNRKLFDKNDIGMFLQALHTEGPGERRDVLVELASELARRFDTDDFEWKSVSELEDLLSIGAFGNTNGVFNFAKASTYSGQSAERQRSLRIYDIIHKIPVVFIDQGDASERANVLARILDRATVTWVNSKADNVLP